jgi:hypothetical protein
MCVVLNRYWSTSICRHDGDHVTQVEMETFPLGREPKTNAIFINVEGTCFGRRPSDEEVVPAL